MEQHTPVKPRFYHTPSSYYSMIARLALAEGGIAWEPVFVDIHFRVSQQRPDYVRLNPNMTVPALVLGDRILAQSRDIAEYALGTSEATLAVAMRPHSRPLCERMKGTRLPARSNTRITRNT